MKQHIQRLLQRRWVLPTITGVVGAGIGGLVGYRFTKAQYDRIEEKMRDIEQETDQLQTVFEHPELDFEEQHHEVTSEDVARLKEIAMRHPSVGMAESFEAKKERFLLGSIDEKAAADVLAKLGSLRLVTDETAPTETRVASNVFDNAGDEWDYKTEIEARDKAQPYIIHVDEYVNNESDYDQSTLTWYEGDQILCDQLDKPIYNHPEVVGDLKFGHGSNDANVVYVRNDKLEHEFEILRDTSSYEETVLGEQLDKAHLKHSATVLKFRDD